MKLSKRSVSIAVFAVFAITAVALTLIAIVPRNDFGEGRPGAIAEISIPEGATGREISTILVEAGVIKDSAKFVSEVLANPKAGGISAGVHRIQTHISAKLAISQLLDQKRLVNIVQVTEGETVSDVLVKLRNNGHIAQGSYSLKGIKPLYANPMTSLEGSIFPAQYSFQPGTSAPDAITTMIDRARSNAQSVGLNTGYLTYSPFQVLTVASMVQIEGDPSTYAKVARVIYNRLRIGMPLQLNSTVQYAINQRGRIALSRNATKTPSLLNTYLHQGLPPTPISNPGRSALSAALHPVEGNWLYFITVKPGETRFTKDFILFQNWTSEFNSNLAAGAFK